MLYVSVKHDGESPLMGDIRMGLKVNKEEKDGERFVPCYVMREGVKRREVCGECREKAGPLDMKVTVDRVRLRFVTSLRSPRGHGELRDEEGKV